MSRTLIKTLRLPYDAVRTVYLGDCEVRLYRNEITGAAQIGKRLDTLGLEEAVAHREATLLKEIRHPNVVPVEDVVRVDGFDATMKVIELIMPYFPRGSVFDCFERGERFSVQEAVNFASMMLRGLRELHEVKGILHRDVKSPNIFLDRDVALVGDLGVAVPMEADGLASPLDSPRLWAPPETYTGSRIGPRADVYQAGLVLLEMVSGPLPYAETPTYDLDAIAERLARGRRAILPRHLAPAPWVPPGVRRVIAKATQIDPARRYDSARTMAEALRRSDLVDWRLKEDETDSKIWIGRSARRTDREFRVHAARKAPDGAWSLSGMQRKTAWRRVVDDQTTAQIHAPQTTHFFDEMVSIANNV